MGLFECAATAAIAAQLKQTLGVVRYRQFVKSYPLVMPTSETFPHEPGAERSQSVRGMGHKHTRSLVLALLVELGVLGHPGPIGIANAKVSDSLSATANMLFMVTFVYFIAKPSQRGSCLSALLWVSQSAS
jgi:hypothetical protein